MIDRYSRQVIAAIWDDTHKYRLWLDIEVAVLRAQEKLKTIPPGIADTVVDKAVIDPASIQAIEEQTRHDVIAFLEHLAQSVGEPARFIHQGMTSSDLLDTCFALQLRQAADILLEDINQVLTALKSLAEKHKNTLCIGRSHGIFAEPTTFGLKMAQAYAEFKRHHQRLIQARQEISTCAISGAVGNFAHLPPEVEALVADQLSLRVEPISSQVIPRDRHGAFFTCLALIASSVERVATEIRLLQRSEVAEVAEPFGQKQKGSSAMPHKRNPVLSENISGLARIVRATVTPALENIVLWHERDISHSSVERIIAPQATITLDFSLYRLANILTGLEVDPEAMATHLDHSCGLYASGQVLVALTRCGLSRQDAYLIVQKHALACWRDKRPLIDALRTDKQVRAHLDEDALRTLFNTDVYTKNIGAIFKRVFT